MLTLPVNETQVVIGKFVAAFISSAVLLVPTLFYVVTVNMFGNPDAGPIICGYFGALLLCAAFSAVGVFASSLTKNQIIAFFVSFIICISLTLLDSFLIFMPAPIVGFFTAISANAHFSSIARGIIDSRDLIFFISVAIIFLSLAILHEQEERN